MKIDTLGTAGLHRGGGLRAPSAAPPKSLHITQTGLTRRLQGLEASLGVRLVERTTRSRGADADRPRFPAAGAPPGRRAGRPRSPRSANRARRGAARSPSPACPRSACSTCRASSSSTRRSIPATASASSTTRRSASPRRCCAREAEFGITLLGAHDPELVSVPLLKDRFVLVCRATIRWRRRSASPGASCSRIALIYSGLESGNRQLLDVALGAQGHAAARRPTRCSAARPRSAWWPRASAWRWCRNWRCRRAPIRELRVIPLVDPVVSRSLVLMTRKNAYLTPAAQALYDLIRAT